MFGGKKMKTTIKDIKLKELSSAKCLKFRIGKIPFVFLIGKVEIYFSDHTFIKIRDLNFDTMFYLEKRKGR